MRFEFLPGGFGGAQDCAGEAEDVLDMHFEAGCAVLGAVAHTMRVSESLG